MSSYYLYPKNPLANETVAKFLGITDANEETRHLRGSECSDGEPRNVYVCTKEQAILFLQSDSRAPVVVLMKYRHGALVRELTEKEKRTLLGIPETVDATPENKDERFEAARKALELRGGGLLGSRGPVFL